MVSPSNSRLEENKATNDAGDEGSQGNQTETSHTEENQSRECNSSEVAGQAHTNNWPATIVDSQETYYFCDRTRDDGRSAVYRDPRDEILEVNVGQKDLVQKEGDGHVWRFVPGGKDEN